MSSELAVKLFGPVQIKVGAGDPLTAVMFIEPLFWFEHDWLLTVAVIAGAVQGAGVVNEQNAPNVRFDVVLKLVIEVEFPTNAVNPDVVTQVKPTC
jgi:hypothetical protein